MRKIYKSVENDIEYLVLESTDYYYINNYLNKNILPDGYEDMKYTKYITYDAGGRTDIQYYYHNLMHNLYGPSFTRSHTINNTTFLSGIGHYIYNKYYSKENWEKRREIFFRREKIEKILNNLVKQK